MENKFLGEFLPMKLIKISALFMAIIFLCFASGCSHTSKQPPNPSSGTETSSPKDTVYYYPPKQEKWWEKDENQYLIVVLVVIGVAIAAGATVAFVSNGGLHVGVNH